MATIDLDEPEPLPEDPAPPVRPAWQRYGLHAVVGLVCMALGVLGTLTYQHAQEPKEQSIPGGMANYEPQSDEERTLLKSLRAPTYTESIAMARASADAGLGATWVHYIATKDFVLPPAPLSQPMMIGVPPGITWQSGPLTNVRLVVASPGVALPLGLRDGELIYDRWCLPSLTNALAERPCQQKRPSDATEKALLGKLRALAREEFDGYPGLMHVDDAVPTREGNVFLATGDVTLSPYLGDPEEVPVIVLDKAARVVGGNFGKIQVVARGYGNGRNVQYEVLHDPVYTLTLPSDNAMAATSERIKLVCGVLSQHVKQTIYPGACPA